MPAVLYAGQLSIKIACTTFMADCWRADTCYFLTAVAALHIPVRLTKRIRNVCTCCGFHVFSVVKSRGSYATPLSFTRNSIYFRHLGNKCVAIRVFCYPSQKKCLSTRNLSRQLDKCRENIRVPEACHQHTRTYVHARRVDNFCRPTVIPLRDFRLFHKFNFY